MTKLCRYLVILLLGTLAFAANSARLPNHNLTPGVSRTTSAKEVCSLKSTKDVRHVSEAQKNAVYAAYGITNHAGYCSGPEGCEVDHLISLELGGANDSANLWPQPYGEHPGAHEKDVLENWLHKQVCTGKMSLRDAQQRISSDWYAEYQKMPKKKSR